LILHIFMSSISNDFVSQIWNIIYFLFYISFFDGIIGLVQKT